MDVCVLLHDDLAQVCAWLQSVFRGWCQYYAVPGNYPRLQQFRERDSRHVAPHAATSQPTRSPSDLAQVRPSLPRHSFR